MLIEVNVITDGNAFKRWIIRDSKFFPLNPRSQIKKYTNISNWYLVLPTGSNTFRVKKDVHFVPWVIMIVATRNGK